MNVEHVQFLEVYWIRSKDSRNDYPMHERGSSYRATSGVTKRGARRPQPRSGPPMRFMQIQRQDWLSHNLYCNVMQKTLIQYVLAQFSRYKPEPSQVRQSLFGTGRRGLTILRYPMGLGNKGLITRQMLIQHAFKQFPRYRAETSLVHMSVTLRDRL